MAQDRGFEFELGGEQKKRIGDHASPQKGFGLSTPRGAEGGGATPGNTVQEWQRERLQAAAHQASSNQALTNMHIRIGNRILKHQT
jgi:hypothetical protein